MKIRNQQKSVASVYTEISDKGDLIPIFPAGLTQGLAHGPYMLSNPDAVIAASRMTNVDPVIDREHAYDLLPAGTPVKAAGWIKELVNIEGAIWAKAEWTPAALEEMANKEYRYISPTFLFDPNTREVTRILRATLTNIPNFDMKAVASEVDLDESAPSTHEKETTEMKPILIALAGMLALASTATEDDILNAAKAKIESFGELEKSFASVKAALKLDEKADVKEVLATASTLQKSTDEPDPTKWIAVTAYKALASEHAALQSQLGKDKATDAVEKAIASGKLPPAQKEWALRFASQNLKEFESFVENQPVLASGDSNINGDPKTGTQELSASAKSVCSQLGLSEKEFKESQTA